MIDNARSCLGAQTDTGVHSPASAMAQSEGSRLDSRDHLANHSDLALKATPLACEHSHETLGGPSGDGAAFWGLSPLRLLLLATLVISSAEAAIMTALSGERGILSAIQHALYDSALLSLVLVPVLYFLFYRPIVAEMARREAAEKELNRRNDERFRLVFEHSPVGIVISRKLKILYSNAAYRRLFGYRSVDELAGKSILDMIAPEYHEVAVASTSAMGPTYERGFKLDIVGRRKDGSTFPYHVETCPIDLSDGRAVVGFVVDITEQKRAEESLKDNFARAQKILLETIQAMAMTVEIKDPYTAGHQARVARLAVAIAAEMGLGDEQLQAISYAAAVHDIGKLYVPTELLVKPGILTENEMALIRTHPRVGYDVLKRIDFPWPVADIVLQHHERLDGSGYPSGLKGDEILEEARVLAVADVVESMASHRPYRPALGINAALDEIGRNKGRLYDLSAVDACIRLFRERGFDLSN